MNDQRQDPRQTLSDATVHVVDDESGVAFAGAGKDVSSSGLSFLSALEPPVGASMNVTVGATPALVGKLEVTRVQSQGDRYEVAGRLRRRR